MNIRRLLIVPTLMFAALTVTAIAQTDIRSGEKTVRVSSPNARMIIASEGPRSFTPAQISQPGLITIFNSLAARYPKGSYWCCQGYNVMGSNSGVGEQWMAAAFTPTANHTVTRIAVAVGYSQQGPNGVVISLNEDNNGAPGQPLQTWNVQNLPRFGSCCGLVVVSDASGVAITGGKQYWLVLSTSSSETSTVDGWNVEDADQVDAATLASYTNGTWTVFQATPGVGFAVQGSN